MSVPTAEFMEALALDPVDEMDVYIKGQLSGKATYITFEESASDSGS